MKILKAAALFSLVAAECSWTEHNKEGSRENFMSACFSKAVNKIIKSKYSPEIWVDLSELDRFDLK